MHEWFTLTYLMGAFFIGGQIYEYAELVHEGLTHLLERRTARSST